MDELNHLAQEIFGTPYAFDPHFNGPTKRRVKTDTSFLVLFGMFVAGWLLIGVWASSTTTAPAGIVVNITKINANGSVHSIQVVQTSFPRRDTTPFDSTNVSILDKYWSTVLTGLLLVMFAALLLVFLMRWIAAPLLWSCIILWHLVWLTGAYYCFTNYPTAHRKYTITCLLLFAVSALIVVFMRKRIKFTLALISEASRPVCTMWSTLLFPIVPALMKIAAILFAIKFHTTLMARAESNHQWSQDALSYLQAYNVFVFCWTLFFVSALGELILATVFGTWYWTYNKDDVPSNALSMAASTSVRYHLGTVAFGSLIIAICRVLSRIFGVGSQHGGGCGPLMCFRCCLCSVEKFLKRFNRNAYIMCAMHGTPFCDSAMDAYKLILRNVLRCIVADSVTTFVFCLIQMLFAVGTGLVTHACLNGYELSDAESLAIIWLSVILGGGAFFIAGAFLSVYSMAVDTLVLCFLEDCERNDGSDKRPYYMSRRLVELLANESSAQTYQPLANDAKIRFNDY